MGSDRWVVDVARDRVFEREPELVGQRRQPREHVTEFVKLLGRRALANSLREFAEFFAEPRNRGGDTTGMVVGAVETIHQCLDFGQLNGG